MVIQLDYTHVITEHFRLGIGFDQTMRMIQTLFPSNRIEAIALWNQLESQKAYSGGIPNG